MKNVKESVVFIENVIIFRCILARLCDLPKVIRGQVVARLTKGQMPIVAKMFMLLSLPIFLS